MSTQTEKVRRVCGRCGATVFADSPRGFCSVCLFKSGLGSLGDDHDGEQEPSRIQMEFGDYELLEEIGRGGQGVVYRARQKSLNRTVALKVIGLGQWSSTPHLKRFRHEAEAAASLEHPQIVPIYEIGERDGSCYFSMKFVEGGRLDEVAKREPMSARRAAELLLKIARTVQFAHEHGILHRDIKPGNILLDRQGEPHLTDFGLARLIEQESTITNSFDVLGTPSYMSPEQAASQAKELTPAADVYSLGAVFYHMLTGEPPFAGGTTYETIRMVLETEPRNPRTRNAKVDVDLATICLKCLEKDPKRRYSSALALAEDLERWLKHEPIRARRTDPFTRGRKWLRRNPATALSVVSLVGLAAAIAVIVWKSELLSHPATKSVAVLPFENLSPNADNVYFAEGVQDEILTRLAKVADLKVISRTSTQHYQSKPRNLREIAKQLGVANILEGSVQKAGNAVRVNVQLINVASDAHLWAETYDRKLTDIFAVESDIAKTIADTLEARLTGSEKQMMAAAPTTDTAAYELYHKGRSLWEKRSGDNIPKSIAFYEQAIARDPNYALAYAGLAKSYMLLPFFTGAERRNVYPKAKEAALKALRLDSKLADAHLALGQVLVFGEIDLAGAMREYKRAIELQPNDATAHHWFGNDTLATVGRFEEAIAEGKRAVELDPLSPIINADLGAVFCYARRYDESAAQLRKTLDIDPTFFYARYNLGIVLQVTGDLSGAIAEYEKAKQLNDDPFMSTLYAAAKGHAGDKDAALRMLTELDKMSAHREVLSYWRALLYLSLNNKDEALRCLEQSFEERDGSNISWIKVDPMLDSLHGDPRFEALVQKVVAPKTRQ